MKRPAAPGEIPVSIWGQFKRHSPRYGVGLLLLALYQYSQYWFDTHLKLAINAATAHKPDVAIQIGAALFSVALAAFVVRVMSRVAIFNGGRIAEYELRRALLDRLQELGPSFYRRMSSGEIMSRVTNDLVQVRLLLGFGILNVINTLFALVSALAVTLGESVALTVASLAPLPVLMLVTRRFSTEIYGRTRANQDAIGQMSERVQSSIAGVRVVRAFTLEHAELESFEKTNQNYLQRSLALARLRGSMGPIMQGITSIGILIVVWYGGYLVLHEEISQGGFLAFFRALGRLTWPLIALGFLVGLVQRGRASYARLAQIYEAEPDIRDGGLPAPTIEGHLEVRGLSFAYGDRSVLEDVTFELSPGQSLAVVGRTGSGKTTLALLLARLQPTPRGSVFLDGHDVCDLPVSAVRSAVGYAQQDAFLFSTTAGRNIAFALDHPESGPALLTIKEAAARAGVLDELLALPDGLDTVVGERGVQLSGGQKQRVALARSFVAASKILILDDPLSAVDAATEQRILQAIETERSLRSVLLITHRVGAAARCDQIVVLDEGRVVARGRHEDLIQQPGVYAEIAEEQRIMSQLAQLGAEALPAVGAAPP